MKRLITSIFIAAITGGLIALQANAHVSVTNKLYSNSYSQIEMTIPHGCDGFDTVKLEVTLPSGLPGVRPLDSEFGLATTEVDEEGNVTKITWKAKKTLYESDSHAYSIAFRTKTPDAVFSTLYFPTVQTCLSPEGDELTSEWVGINSGHDHEAESEVLPAPYAVLYPKVAPGWHQFTATDHLHDMGIFNDAEIVWKGDEAYSANAHTMTMIEDDATATVLSEIHPAETFWVKY